MKDRTLIAVTLAIMIFFALASPVIEILGSTGVIENRLASRNLIVPEPFTMKIVSFPPF